MLTCSQLELHQAPLLPLPASPQLLTPLQIQHVAVATTAVVFHFAQIAVEHTLQSGMLSCLIVGPFANIAHGNSSVVADKLALKLVSLLLLAQL